MLRIVGEVTGQTSYVVTHTQRPHNLILMIHKKPHFARHFELKRLN